MPATRSIGLAVLLATLAGVGMCWTAGTLMTMGRHSAVPAARPPGRDLRIMTRDGVSLAATFRPGPSAKSPAVLLLHGVNASRAATADNAVWLAGLGYATLTIDFRGHGESTLTTRTFGFDETNDAAAAFAWLKRRQQGAPVAVIGISMGGASVLLGRDGPLPADALILQAVYPDIRHAIRDRIARRLGAIPALLLEPLLSFQSRARFGVWPASLSPITALPRYRGPVMVIGGLHDGYTPPAETRTMFAAASGRKTLWLRSRGDHADVCDARDGDYRRRVAVFLETTIGR